MNPPSKLGDFFGVVDDFFKKTFRDDSQVFLAVKSRQYSESFPGKQLFFTIPQTSSQASGESHTPEEAATMSSKKTNYMTFSPRLVLNNDGTAFGKVKLGCGLHIPRVCRFEQGLTLTNKGVVSTELKLIDILEGLELKGRIAVNTIAPASEDVSVATIDYQRRDFYTSLGYQRNGLGSSDLLLDCGTKFFNLLLGAGFERQQLSYLEHQDASAQMDVLYAGLGFTGVNWSIGAKMVRANDAWNTARVAFYQRMAPSTMVACGYNFELSESRAHLSLGFSQGFRLRVPTILQQRSEEQVDAWTAILPFVGAVKAESDGVCAATLRGIFNGVVHWALIARKNVLHGASPVRYGVTISMESD
ncbi:putative suppressive immunomodulating factor [Trypanosoma rangeli]|uniref:Putative suppressive immunomodulating factor n=1 Tax=Trypanosoma rangeli TaxID=5698 RepID=A0A3R7KID6_TRYRA|nr:putative suppressive immunomodulating factor [Trypanosoma rangeli]RNF07054.1 putative suppressive immunomodulating factor [Trypanosoma rangeli]|eukprot:RNF07054.1 putative suppressive immunomodulating factor [Trypanosoma rangeli]